MSFKFSQLDIPDLLLVKPRALKDDRGFFTEIYKATDFEKSGIRKPFRQLNHSQSFKNVLRGLHYQLAPMTQVKFVRVLSGEIFDVAVDIRQGSPYYGRWVGIKLCAEDGAMFYVPEGFAHGFCVLSTVADVEYLSSQVYSPQHERGILWNDPALNIQWPVKDPILSVKDKNLPSLESAENNFIYAEK